MLVVFAKVLVIAVRMYPNNSVYIQLTIFDRIIFSRMSSNHRASQTNIPPSGEPTFSKAQGPLISRGLY